jgi:hypothetical protein
MPWKKGQSGKPKGVGVGKEKLMRQALMMELKSAGEDLPELRQIARRVIDCALNDEENWSWAVKEIWDRLDGKPHQTVEAALMTNAAHSTGPQMSCSPSSTSEEQRQATETLIALTE